MAQQPDGVSLNQGRFNELVATYRAAIKKIEGEFTGSTEFGQARRQQILANVRLILTRLGADMAAWAETEMPDYYRQGIEDAIQGLSRLNIDIPDTREAFTVIDSKAVAAIVSEVQDGFATSMEGIFRASRRVLTYAEKQEIKQQLALGAITGESQRETARQVKGYLQEQGLTALTDRSGKRWELDQYAQMLVRTKAVEARNAGLANTMSQNGYDLVQVSDHGSSHPECARWEGQVLSLTGNTPGYPTVDEATADGLFHPNCQHAMNVVEPDLASRTNAYGQEED